MKDILVESETICLRTSAVRGSCSVWAIGEGVLQMWTSALFGTKTPDFSKFMVCPHGQEREGWSNADILRTRGKGINFSQFCTNVFYRRPLRERLNIIWRLFSNLFRPPPPSDGILTFLANPLPHMTFSTSPSPTYTVNRARGTAN